MRNLDLDLLHTAENGGVELKLHYGFRITFEQYAQCADRRGWTCPRSKPVFSDDDGISTLAAYDLVRKFRVPVEAHSALDSEGKAYTLFAIYSAKDLKQLDLRFRGRSEAIETMIKQELGIQDEPGILMWYWDAECASEYFCPVQKYDPPLEGADGYHSRPAAKFPGQPFRAESSS